MANAHWPLAPMANGHWPFCCIKRYTSDTRGVKAFQSYTAIQRYTVYSYTSLYSIQPLHHPSEEHKLGLEYNVATIGFVHGIDAAGARIALDNEDLLRSGCIKVDFCAGHEHDVTMDDAS